MRETLNQIAARVHTANFKWWLDLNKKCPKCNGEGRIARKDLVGAGAIIPTLLHCEDCRGTGYAKLARNVGEMLMLAASELSEALEGHRKQLPDDKLPQFRMFDVEIVDCFIRLFDTSYGLRIDLGNNPSKTLNGFRDMQIGLVKPRIDNVAEELLIATGYIYDVYTGKGCMLEVFDNLFWISAKHNIDLDIIFEAKMNYNAVRKDHSLEHRLSEHGKRY